MKMTLTMHPILCGQPVSGNTQVVEITSTKHNEDVFCQIDDILRQSYANLSFIDVEFVWGKVDEVCHIFLKSLNRPIASLSALNPSSQYKIGDKFKVPYKNNQDVYYGLLENIDAEGIHYVLLLDKEPGNRAMGFNPETEDSLNYLVNSNGWIKINSFPWEE
jgi:hypothetical protein